MYRFTFKELCKLREEHPLDGLRGGETIHIDHIDCPSGVDHRRRLYITRTEDRSTLLFFCHHCGGRGMLRIATYRPAPTITGAIVGDTDKGVLTSTTKDLQKVYDSFADPSTFDPDHYIKCAYPNYETLAQLRDVWEVMKSRNYYGLRLRFDDLYWSKKGKTETVNHLRYIVPQFEDGIITGVWIRNHHSSSHKVIVYGSARQQLFDETKKPEDHIFIVEDPISAVKLNCMGQPAFSLGGLNLSTEMALKLSMLYQTAYVWLDNDTPALAKTVEIQRTLELVGLKVKATISDIQEPKKHSIHYIAGVLVAHGLDNDLGL